MSDKKYAVLIDADNVSDKYIKAILDEISNEGTITFIPDSRSLTARRVKSLSLETMQKPSTLPE